MGEPLFGTGEGAIVTAPTKTTGGYYIALQDADTGKLWSLSLIDINIAEARDMTSLREYMPRCFSPPRNMTRLRQGYFSHFSSPRGCSRSSGTSDGSPELGDGAEAYRDTSPANYRRVNVYVQTGRNHEGVMYRGFVTSIVRGRSHGKALGNEVYSLTIVAVAA